MQPLGSAPIQIRKPLPPPPGKGAPKNLPVTVPPPGSPPDMPKAAAPVQPQPPLTSLKERGDFHRGRKEFDLALIAYNDALRGMEEGPEKAAILSAMASISVEQKDYPKAHESYTKALAMLIDVYGDDNPSVADIKKKMANLPLPKTDRASQDSKASAVASSSASGLDNMLSIQNSLPAAASPAPAQQKTITIDELLVQLERQKKEHGACHLSVAETQNQIGAFYISSEQKAAEALNLITMSLVIRQKLQGKDSLDHIETHNLCFAAFHANKKTKQGIYHLEEVVRIMKKNKKEGTPEFVEACGRVGAVILGSNAKIAKTYFEDGLASQKKIKGNAPDETTATLLKNLALARLTLAESSKAIPLLEEALIMNKALYKVPHANIIDILYILGVCYKQNKQKANTKDTLNLALQMSIALNGEKHPKTLEIKKSL